MHVTFSSTYVHLCESHLVRSQEHLVKREKRTSALQLYALTMLIGVPLNLAFGLRSLFTVDWSAVTLSAWIGLGYSSIMVQVIAMALYTWALSHVSGPTAALYMGVQSIVGEFLAATVSTPREPIRAYKIIGCVFIIIGLVIATSAKRKRTITVATLLDNSSPSQSFEYDVEYEELHGNGSDTDRIEFATPGDADMEIELEESPPFR